MCLIHTKNLCSNQNINLLIYLFHQMRCVFLWKFHFAYMLFLLQWFGLLWFFQLIHAIVAILYWHNELLFFERFIGCNQIFCFSRCVSSNRFTQRMWMVMMPYIVCCMTIGKPERTTKTHTLNVMDQSLCI